MVPEPELLQFQLGHVDAQFRLTHLVRSAGADAVEVLLVAQLHLHFSATGDARNLVHPLLLGVRKFHFPALELEHFHEERVPIQHHFLRIKQYIRFAIVGRPTRIVRLDKLRIGHHFPFPYAIHLPHLRRSGPHEAEQEQQAEALSQTRYRRHIKKI